MTHGEFTQILKSLGGLSAEQMQQLRRELDRRLSPTLAASEADADPILGMGSDDAELIDQIVEDAMRNRREQPWRLTTGE
jgi:hypothetical protein